MVQRNLEKQNSPIDVSDGKEKTRPQVSNQPHESSLHSRENRGEPSTSTHQVTSEEEVKQKIKGERRKSKLLAKLVRAL